MTTPTPTPAAPTTYHVPNRDTVIGIIGHPMRWEILKVLCDGEGYGISDLAPLVKCSGPNVSRHLALLKQAGLVVQGRGKLYRIQPYLLPTPGQKTLDLGHCVLRLDFQEG